MTQETKEQFFNRLKKTTQSYHHQYYSNKEQKRIDETYLEVGFKSDWKQLRQKFVKLLRQKKESNILFNGWYFEREKEYNYPDKETMYKYYGLEDFFTGKYEIKIWKKDSFPCIYIYEKDFLK